MRLLLHRRDLFALAASLLGVPATMFGARRAPVLRAETIVGKKIRLDEYKGKTLILTFWATWCPHCRRQIDVMEKIHQELKAKGVMMLALSVDQDGWAKVGPYLNEKKLTLPIGLTEQTTARAYGADGGIPFTVLVDGEGELLGGTAGALDEATLRAVAEKYAPGAQAKGDGPGM